MCKGRRVLDPQLSQGAVFTQLATAQSAFGQRPRDNYKQLGKKKKKVYKIQKKKVNEFCTELNCTSVVTETAK